MAPQGATPTPPRLAGRGTPPGAAEVWGNETCVMPRASRAEAQGRETHILYTDNRAGTLSGGVTAGLYTVCVCVHMKLSLFHCILVQLLCVYSYMCNTFVCVCVCAQQNQWAGNPNSEPVTPCLH